MHYAQVGFFAQYMTALSNCSLTTSITDIARVRQHIAIAPQVSTEVCFQVNYESNLLQGANTHIISAGSMR